MKRTMGLLVAVALLLGVSGCEDGGGSLGDGHDFGANDPQLYVAMGDSITAGGASWPAGLSTMLGKSVVNEAGGGEMSGDGAAQAGSVLTRYQPGYLLILYGANDVIMGSSSSSIADNLRHMADVAYANQTIPVIATLTPMTEVHSIFNGSVQAANAAIVQMGNDNGIAIVRLDEAFGDGTGYLESDGLHPNDAGQQLIAQAFFDTLN